MTRVTVGWRSGPGARRGDVADAPGVGCAGFMCMFLLVAKTQNMVWLSKCLVETLETNSHGSAHMSATKLPLSGTHDFQ
jgi:hypothetical protein